MKNRNILISALCIVIALVFGIVVAYAALSATLSAKFNSVTAVNGTWDVGLYKNWNGTDGYSTNDNSEVNCGWVTFSQNSITVDSITLSKPGDDCNYLVPLNNYGDIDAKLSTIAANEPTGVTCSKRSLNGTIPSGTYERNIYGYEMVCGNLTYSISFDSDMIYKGSNNWGTLSVAYTGNDLNTTPVVHNNPGFTLVFGQA